MVDWNEFVKPDLGKGIIFALFAGANYFLINFMTVMDARKLVGLPLGFYPIGSRYCPNVNNCPPGPEFSILNLILNIVIWYAIACIIIYAYNQLFKKSAR